MTGTRIDELTRLVLAPNASPMTLEGTNTYLLGDPDHGAVVVVDPGPDDPDHRAAVEAARGGREVATVVITHQRREQVLAAIGAGASSTEEIVRMVYADVPEVLHPAAAQSVKAVLAMMAARGEVDATLAPDARR